MERNWAVSVAGLFFGVHDSGPGSSSGDAVLDRLLPDMKSDLRLGRLGRRFEQWAELLEYLAQGRVVKEQSLINLRQALQDGGIGRDCLAHFYERANDIDTHRNSPRTLQEVRGHKCSVLGKGVGQILEILSSIQGHIL